jgi:uncharacterized protein YdeI (YjbR/CyaY-like superfamily)
MLEGTIQNRDLPLSLAAISAILASMNEAMRAGLPVMSFPDAAAFEAWISAAPGASKGLWLRLAKKGADTASLSRAEAIDVALCHGWIDGQIDKYDDVSWLIRFTPRKPASRWSAVNRARALELIEALRMRPTGLAAVEAAKADGRWETAYAPASTAQPSAELQAGLDASPQAAAFFATLTGANRYAVIYRVDAAKRPETRAKRVAAFVAMLARGETIHGPQRARR